MPVKFLDRMITEAAPILEACGCELVDAEYKKEGSQNVLRLTVERLEGSITLDDCATINRMLSDRLDGIDTGTGSFILEISSPGVERPLKTPKDFKRFCGCEVDVSLYKAMDGKKKFTAILASYDEEAGIFAFDAGSGEMPVPQANIAKINLHFSF